MGATFNGIILSLKQTTLTVGSDMNGRILSQDAVTLQITTVTEPTGSCSAPTTGEFFLGDRAGGDPGKENVPLIRIGSYRLSVKVTAAGTTGELRKSKPNPARMFHTQTLAFSNLSLCDGFYW